MLDKISEIRKKLETVSILDISHEDLGTTNGFHEAEESKVRVLQYINEKLVAVEQYMGSLDEIAMVDNLTHIDNVTNQIIKYIGLIDNLVKEGVHNTNYPNQRKKYINGFKAQEVALKKALYHFDLEIRVCELKSLIRNDGQLEKSTDEVKKLKKDIEKNASESRKILDSLQNEVSKVAIKESVSGFGTLRKEHRRYEIGWFIAFILTSIFVVLAFYNAITADIDFTNYSKAVFDFIKKLLLISIPSIFLRISIGKYNLERNLRIIYSHRESVLNQYKRFEIAIGDDSEAKNALRIEIAKYIFSDPRTGYLGKDSRASDVNINPIVNLAEQFTNTK